MLPRYRSQVTESRREDSDVWQWYESYQPLPYIVETHLFTALSLVLISILQKWVEYLGISQPLRQNLYKVVDNP